MRYSASIKHIAAIAAFSSSTILISAILPSVAEAKSACHCRTAIGERVLVGNYTCIKTPTGLKEARCDFVLNNTAWKLTGNLCPSVNLTPFKDQKPLTMTALAILSRFR